MNKCMELFAVTVDPVAPVLPALQVTFVVVVALQTKQLVEYSNRCRCCIPQASLRAMVYVPAVILSSSIGCAEGVINT